VLGGGLALAVVLGAAAAMLAPGPTTMASAGPGNLVLPVGERHVAPTAAVLQAELLEKLIVEAEVSDNPAALPSLATFVLLVKRDPEVAGWVVDRLGREDVSAGLAIAFARGLPSGNRALDGAVHGALIRHLRGDDGAARREAVEVLKARGQFEGTVDRSCDCVVGTYSHAGATWSIRQDRSDDGATTFQPTEATEATGAVDTSGSRL